ncbi:hypothetical protein AWZ03_001626 [Drosophila navojoa]|uniref:Gustatory receptor n=1 Tax=Drosophila navojoa TaxID=7232 RepID=A0A484BT17_DRONA|nr:hypothetical protein AWZ03_001626 [Drosophila navojoa]
MSSGKSRVGHQATGIGHRALDELQRLAMHQYKPAIDGVELWSRRVLLALYQAARGLSLLSSSLGVEREQLQLRPPRQQCNRLLIILWRAILVSIYWNMIPGIFNSVKIIKTYAALIVLLQSSSVSLFAVGSFIMQVRAESRFTAVLNHYISLYGRICVLTGAEHLFTLKFPIFYALKLILTLCGCLYELPQLLPLRYILHMDVGHVIGGLIAIYLWLGTIFLLDACFLGFFVSGVLYEHMGSHIAIMLQQMRSIDMDDQVQSSDDESEPNLNTYENWQILFYIYYNLIVLLIMLYEYIVNYLEGTQGEMVPVVMTCIKMANIVLLIMCADYMIKKSTMPQILPLDIVCTDMDQRWDKSRPQHEINNHLQQKQQQKQQQQQRSLHNSFKI